jgi:hypothetical protein
VRIGKIGDRFFASPLSRGSGVITSLTKADGIIRIPAFSEGLDENEETDADLLKPLEEIVNTVVMVGSHDLTLDILALLGRLSSVYFSSTVEVSRNLAVRIESAIWQAFAFLILKPEYVSLTRQYLEG